VAVLGYVSDSYEGRFTEGLHQGVELLIHQSAWSWHVTVQTLQLAIVASAIGMLVGIPVGCPLGLGRSSASRVLLGIANTLTRVPPVAAGLVVLLMVRQAGPYGGGPLAGLAWEGTLQSGYLAQSLLAIPIVTVASSSRWA
jgi:ABC-type tungstate transport system substrate-binding protein